MSRIVETKRFDDESIIRLWREAFGDSREDVEFFLDYCENKSILCRYNDNGELCSMLFLVDSYIDNVKYKYIYAASTFKKYRGIGYMTELLDFAKGNYTHIALIPADDKLADYYGRRGFINKFPVNKICFYETEDVVEFLLEGCELKEPFVLGYIGE